MRSGKLLLVSLVLFNCGLVLFFFPFSLINIFTTPTESSPAPSAAVQQLESPAWSEIEIEHGPFVKLLSIQKIMQDKLGGHVSLERFVLDSGDLLITFVFEGEEVACINSDSLIYSNPDLGNLLDYDWKRYMSKKQEDVVLDELIYQWDKYEDWCEELSK